MVCFDVRFFGSSSIDDLGLIDTIWVNDPSNFGFWVDDPTWVGGLRC